MSLVKVIEVIAQSDKSWEDAVKNAVAETAKTVENIKSVYVKDFQATVEKNNITMYRADVKISFLVNGR